MDDTSKTFETLFNLIFFSVFIFVIILSFYSRIKKRTSGPVKFGEIFNEIMKSLAAGRTGKESDEEKVQAEPTPTSIITTKIMPLVVVPKLKKRQKYLQVALNSTLEEAKDIIYKLPRSENILVEAGTPLIKIYGQRAIREIKIVAPAGTYIVADTKTADLAYREVAMVAQAGAQAATCVGVAPVETINSFIEECQKYSIDSMIDMMNVTDPLFILKKLKKLPSVVVLHRGVDESEFSEEKQIPYYQIQQIKGNYDILVSVAGGDTSREIQRAVFNNADIVVVWKNFYHSTAETANLANNFLKEIKVK